MRALRSPAARRALHGAALVLSVAAMIVAMPFAIAFALAGSRQAGR